jgi:predicted KAP-like P-loop ATPase
MWADHETSIDLLGFDHLVGAVEDIVKNDDLLPATVGVFGDWGSGKSSLLKIVTKSLQADPKVLTLEFNGWLFEGYDDAKAALLETIVGELVSRKKDTLTDEAKRIGLRLLRRINWFRVAATAGKSIGKYGAAFAVGGPPAAGVVAVGDAVKLLGKAQESLESLDSEKIQELLADESEQTIQATIRDFRREFRALLDATDIATLVVVIDDLDRCLPDTIIETFEAIKLFLFVPHSAFIIGADERLVKYAVQRRFPELPGSRAEVGRDYLEKLIQYPVRVPALGRVELETYISLLFTQLAGVGPDQLKTCAEWAFSAESIREGRAFGSATAQDILKTIPDELPERLALASRISTILAPGLNGNPRQCKRFLNMLLMRLSMAERRGIKDLQQRVLAKLMLLEYLRSQAFKRLAELQAQQEGAPKELAALEAHAKAKASEEVSSDGPENSEQVSLPPLAAEMEAWLNDEFICQWLGLEPPLASVDLRPYVFFSRDALGSMGAAIQRLSPQAQEVLSKLLSDAESVRGLGVKESEHLSPADAAAVFQELVSRAGQEQDWSTEDCVFYRLFNYVAIRKDLGGELVTFLRRAPDGQLPVDVVPRLRNTCADSPAQATAETLINEWKATSPNALLKRAAGSKTQKSER